MCVVILERKNKLSQKNNEEIFILFFSSLHILRDDTVALATVVPPFSHYNRSIPCRIV